MKTPLGTELDLGAGHIVLDGFPAIRERGTTPPPLLGPCLLWPRSPISATAELLLLYQTAGYIKMRLGMDVDFSPDDFVLDGDPAPLPKRGGAPQFSAHVYCGQTAAWIKIPLGTEVRLGLCDILLDGDPAPLP